MSVDLYQKWKNIQIQICQLTSRVPSLQVGVANSRKQHLSPFTLFTESVSKVKQLLNNCTGICLF